MEYPIIDNLISAYLINGWTGLDIPGTVTYEPIQLGIGDPSPTNVRPILPAKTLNVGGNIIDIYGGALDTATKTLTINKSIVYFGDLTWTFYSAFHMFLASVPLQKTSYQKKGIASEYAFINEWVTGPLWVNGDNVFTLQGTDKNIRVKSTSYNDADLFKTKNSNVQFVYELENPVIYQLTDDELYNAIGIKDDIAHRLKLPMLKYFSHVVIEALQKAAAGTQTADDEEILRHYLAPLGIGGI